MRFDNPGLWGIIILIADIYAIVNIALSSSPPLKKAIWIAVVVLMPVLGFILWLLLGPKSR